MSGSIQGEELLNDPLIFMDFDCDVVDVVIDDRDNDKGDNSDDENDYDDNDEADTAVLRMLAIQLSFHLKRHDKARQQITVLENRLDETRKRKRRAESNSYTSLEPMYKYRCSVLSNAISMYDYYRQHHYDCARDLAQDVLVQMEQDEGELITGHRLTESSGSNTQYRHRENHMSNIHLLRSQNLSNSLPVALGETTNHNTRTDNQGPNMESHSSNTDIHSSNTETQGSLTESLFGSRTNTHTDHMYDTDHMYEESISTITHRVKQPIHSVHNATRNM